MNPGPWGMAQTGVPFGDVRMVRDWLSINGPVGHPPHEHPKRPILGFGCHRQEVSGRRFWGWARARFATPERFFQQFFVLNYCPLLFLEKSGRNRTPDKLHTAERSRLYRPCDAALLAAVELLRPRFVLGLGRFAEARIRILINDPAITVGCLPHPSPAHPPNNNGPWSERMDRALTEFGFPHPR